MISFKSFRTCLITRKELWRELGTRDSMTPIIPATAAMTAAMTAVMTAVMNPTGAATMVEANRDTMESIT